MSSPPTPLLRTSGLHWRLLQPQDLDAMEALHHLSIAGLPPHTVKAEARTFLQSLLQGRGTVIGAWHHHTELIAYGVLQHDLLPTDDPREHLQLPPQQTLAKLAGAAVAPQWRGYGLQRALITQRIAHTNSTTVLFATAAPENTVSWHNLLGCGFRVRALEYRYGGFARYLLVRLPSHAPPQTSDASPLELHIDALAQQQTLLAQGWQGIAPGTLPGSLRLQPPTGNPG